MNASYMHILNRNLLSRRQDDSLGPSNDDPEQVTTSLILLWLSSQ